MPKNPRTVRFDPILDNAVARIAVAEQRSFSQMVRVLLAEALAVRRAGSR